MRRIKKQTKVLAGLLLSLSATSAPAQVSLLPELIVSASQFPLTSERAGASVTVLSGEKLREAGIVNLADALRTVPGVAVTQSGGRGTVTEVRIRGAEANHLLVQIDGIEMNQVGEGGFDFADLPTDDVERVEVVRGPQSGIYGANAHAGVISIVTRSGKGLTRPRLDARIEGGSDRTLSGSVNVRGAAGPAYGSLTVTNYSTDGFNISRFGSERDGSQAITATAKGGVDFTEYFNVEGVVRYTRRSVETDPQDFDCVFDPGTGACPPVNPNTFGLVVDSPIDRTDYRTIASRVGATLKLFDGRWVQTANARRLDEKLRGFTEFFTFGNDSERTTLDYKSTFLFDTNLFGGERHTFSVLVEDRRQVFTQPGDPKRYVKDRIGLAAEYVLDLPTHTTLSGAIRQDWNEPFQDARTWRIALSQRLAATGTRIHASAGKGTTEPTVFEVLGFPGFNVANPGIAPEQSIGWDIGVEQRFLDGRLVTDLTYFESKFRNKIELSFNGSDLIYINGAGVAERRGVEFAAAWQVFDWLLLNATYTWLDAIDSLGRKEIRRPPHSASIEFTALSPDRRGRAVIGAIYNSDRRDFFFSTIPTSIVDIEGATVVRAMLSYDVTRSTTAFVRAENLLDHRYEEILSFQMPRFQAFAGLRVRLGAE